MHRDLAAVGIGLGMVGGVLTLTVVGAILGIPMVILAVVVLIASLFMSDDDSDGGESPSG